MAKTKETKTASSETAQTKARIRRVVAGMVVSDKMMKTRVVMIERPVRDSRYGKIIRKTTKVKAHDENNLAATGDYVSIVETKPMSKDKRWAIQKIIRKSAKTINVIDDLK